jgi:hypothetical protein
MRSQKSAWIQHRCRKDGPNCCTHRSPFNRIFVCTLLLWCTAVAADSRNDCWNNSLLLTRTTPSFMPPLGGWHPATNPSFIFNNKARKLAENQGDQPASRRLLQSPASLLDRSGGLVYRTSVFQPDEYNMIANEISAFAKSSLQEESASSVAQNRLGIALSERHSETVKLLQDPMNSLTALVQKIAATTTTKDEMYALAPHIPVEVRSYEKTGACMAWHVDDILYDPPQIEVVWTLENTSDCQTVWKINDGMTATKMHCLETDRNSVLLLRAGVTPHCVTSLKRGKRTILKCAYVVAGATYLMGPATASSLQFGRASIRTKATGTKARRKKR